MRIGICDDEEKQRRNLTNLCTTYCNELGMEYELVEYTSGEEVVKSLKDKILDLLFLDIEMTGMSGIEVMRAIENTEYVWRIVFVSNHSSAVFHTFGLKTLDFGRKPVSYDDVKRWIDIAVNELKEEVVICFEKEDRSKCVRISSIVYLEADANYVKVYTKSRSFFAVGNLKYWHTQLMYKQMLRIHKSYLVNMDYIVKIGDKVTLVDGFEELPIGRSYKGVVKDQYNEYIMKRIRGRL